MEINSKRRRYTRKTPVDGDGIDIISNLPKDILCHILSFLPTKYAAGTSILSKKWRNLLPLIPNLSLELDDCLLLNPRSPPTTHLASFAKFAYNLLNVTLRDVPSLSSLTLSCFRFHDGRVIAQWVNAALRRNIKNMHIQLYHLHPQSHKPLFDSLFGCNIVSLNLLLNFPENLTEFRFSFPNLKRLCVLFTPFHLVNALLLCCPVLEYLLLNKCYSFYHGADIRICVPLLKDLEIVNFFFRVNFVIELDAPGLLYLKHSGFLAIRYWVKEMKSLRLAHLDLEDSEVPYEFDSDELAAGLLKVCSGVEKLSLSKKFILMLHHHPHQLPRFHKLVDLTIKDMELYGWELLPSLLGSAPKIKNLYIEEGFNNILFESFKAAVAESMSIAFSGYDGEHFHLVIQRNVGI